MTTGISSKVMLVEDDAAMRDVLTTLLEIEGFQVAVAPPKGDLEAMLQEIRAAQPDVLLLDVHLRDLSGYDVVKRLRAEEGPARMRVIMSSGMDLKDRCLAAGADDFLMKPYMPDELLQKLHG